MESWRSVFLNDNYKMKSSLVLAVLCLLCILGGVLAADYVDTTGLIVDGCSGSSTDINVSAYDDMDLWTHDIPHTNRLLNYSGHACRSYLRVAAIENTTCLFHDYGHAYSRYRKHYLLILYMYVCVRREDACMNGWACYRCMWHYKPMYNNRIDVIRR